MSLSWRLWTAGLNLDFRFASLMGTVAEPMMAGLEEKWEKDNSHLITE